MKPLFTSLLEREILTRPRRNGQRPDPELNKHFLNFAVRDFDNEISATDSTRFDQSPVLVTIQTIRFDKRRDTLLEELFGIGFAFSQSRLLCRLSHAQAGVAAQENEYHCENCAGKQAVKQT